MFRATTPSVFDLPPPRTVLRSPAPSSWEARNAIPAFPASRGIPSRNTSERLAHCQISMQVRIVQKLRPTGCAAFCPVSPQAVPLSVRFPHRLCRFLSGFDPGARPHRLCRFLSGRGSETGQPRMTDQGTVRTQDSPKVPAELEPWHSHRLCRFLAGWPVGRRLALLARSCQRGPLEVREGVAERDRQRPIL